MKEMKPTSKQQAAKCLVILTFLTTAHALQPAVSSRASPNDILPTPPANSQPTLSSTKPPADHYYVASSATTSASALSQAPAPVAAVAVESRSESSAAQSATTKAATTPQHLDSSWIESILNKVELMNDQHDNDDQLEDNNEDLNQPSLAPTDSGEDPLETSTVNVPDVGDLLQPNMSTSITNVTLSHDQTKATQYTLTGSAGDQNPSSEQSVRLVSPSFDDEQRLVDSNNVSAVLEASSSTVVQLPSPPLHHQVTAEKQQRISCEQAYTRCAQREVCAPALKAYNDDCKELINNSTSQCSAKCLKAMIALRSSEEGDDLVNCDCQRNEYCLQSKQRSLACKPQVEEAVDPKTVVSCSVASWICMADQLCSTALEYYYRNCQSLFSQRYCSMRCNNSLSILYRQPKASKLINCQCDGTEEFPCVRYKTYTERLCLNKLTPMPTQMNADNMEITDNNSNEQQEDESFNMTSDSETFILGSSSRGVDSDTGEDEQDASKYEQSTKRTAPGGISNDHAEESSSSAGSDGILLDEDNWIPLISGRYFMNLNQRKQQQQHRQRQRHRQQVQPHQQLRRTQKNVKQKTKSNSSSAYSLHDGNRRRYGRILMLTSSHATNTCRPSKLHIWALFSTAVLLVCLSNTKHIIFTSLLLH